MAVNAAELGKIARAMVARGKGILAADESSGTMGKRLQSIGVPDSVENRRAYREMLFTTKGAGEYVSGAILYDETIRQSTADGRGFVDALKAEGILAGIKVDTGAKPLAGGRKGETITEGLDGLRERLKEYHGMGARFTKWRAVIAIGDGMPSRTAIETNAHALARYAALCQEAGLVPIVEPEVLMDGSHSIERCREVTEETLNAVYEQLFVQNVILEGTILKPNMVVAGANCKDQPSMEQVAEATIKTLRRCVPGAVPGIAFLSGGQEEEDSTAHLNAMNALGPQPWEVSFSYGRALQHSALNKWAGKPANVKAAQAIYLHRARMNSLARSAKYSADKERQLAA